MATLEKIRSKSVLLVSIIGVALVLFIITLVDNPLAMFQDTTSIAKVGNHKISVEEFNRRSEMEMQRNSDRSVDNAVLQAQVMQGLITEALVNEEYDRLGITVTAEELTEAMIGENAHPSVAQWAAQAGATPRQLYDMIFNPAQFGMDLQIADQFKAQWIEMERMVENDLKSAKFQGLLAGAITANKLDAKALYDEGAKTWSIRYAKADLSSVPDSAVKVTDADIRALYNDSRETYALVEPTRKVMFVNLPVVPSMQDRLAAQQAVEAGIVALREQPAMEGLVGQNAFTINRAEAPESNITPVALRTFLSEASVGDVQLVSNTGNMFEIAKLLGKANKVNEVTYDMVGVNTDEVSVDSIKPLLAAAASLDSVAGVTGSQTGQSLNLATAGLTSDVLDQFRNTPAGTFFKVAEQGPVTILARVTERKAPVSMIEYATATYNVEPSQQTYEALRSQLRHFLDSTATATSFTMENALSHGLSASQAMVTPSSPMLANINDSRDMVYWAMNAKKGQVSDIFNDDRNSRLSAVALVDIYDDYVPVSESSVADRLRIQAMADKKAEKLIAQYQGKGNDVAQYAAAMGTEADTTTVNFSQMYIPRLGAQQSALTASVAASDNGSLNGPMQANGSVIVYEVISTEESAMPYNEEDYRTTFDRTRGNSVMMQRLPLILLGNNKVENRTLKFYTR